MGQTGKLNYTLLILRKNWVANYLGRSPVIPNLCSAVCPHLDALNLYPREIEKKVNFHIRHGPIIIQVQSIISREEGKTRNKSYYPSLDLYNNAAILLLRLCEMEEKIKV